MPVRTTTDTFDEFTWLISWTKLPKRILDAILISRNLGLQSLWIDSIRIIQSSLDDCEIESGRMVNIYPNGFVTIAAASSPGFTSGYLLPRVSSQARQIR